MRGDGKSVVWQKILGHYQSVSGANPAFNPNRTDPLWMTKYKIRRSLGAATGGGGGGGTPVACSDSDASSFLSTIGNTNPTITTAICNLVGSLKSAGVWALMDAIYPFVGGTSASNSLNLKNPATFAITWHGAVTFSATGPTADGFTGYGDTGFNPSTTGGNYSLNSASIGIYSNIIYVNAWMGASFGATNFCGVGANTLGLGEGLEAWGLNANNKATLGGVGPFFMVSRTNNSTCTCYATDLGTVPDNTTATNLPNNNIFVFAFDINGTPLNFGRAILRFAFIGGGLTGPQAAAMQAAVLAFQTALSRN